MNGPTDVLEVGVIKELVGELLHPLPDLVHTDGPEQGQYWVIVTAVFATDTQ